MIYTHWDEVDKDCFHLLLKIKEESVCLSVCVWNQNKI